MTFSQENIADLKQIPHFYHTKDLFIEKSAYELNFSLFCLAVTEKSYYFATKITKQQTFRTKRIRKLAMTTLFNAYWWWRNLGFKKS